MGRPKAWLELGDETLLHRVARVLAASCPVVVVVASPEQSLPPLPDGVVRVDDPAELAGGGPLVGALTGMNALTDLGADVVYLGAVDAAWLSREHVDAMFRVLARHPGAMAVVPETGPTGDGARIVHATSGAVRLAVARDTAHALVSSGQRALVRLFDGLAARRVAIASLPDKNAVRPCNTQADYDAVREWIARHA